MLRLVLAGGEVACPRHEAEEVSPTSSATSHETAQEHHHGADHQQESAPEEQPVLPDCCQAMATCASGVAIAASNGAPILPPAHIDAFSRVASLTLSRVESPDPPPPKA